MGDFESDVRQLLEQARKVAEGATGKEDLETLQGEIENVEAWFENDDPRSMGWVSDSGLP